MDHKIIGTTMPVLEISLQPSESVFAESGELSWLSDSVVMSTDTQAGGGGGVFGAMKRSMGGGGSLFMTTYAAQQNPGMVAFAASMPGQIFPLDVAPQPGMGFLGHRHAFVCGTPGIELSYGFTQSLGAGIFGGDGFRLQKIIGQGQAWVQLSGEVITYDLQPGQTLRVHPGHVGLFQDTVQFTITTVPGIKNKIFGGDGIFLALMTGPGRVWLQSLPISRLAASIAEYMPAGQQAGAVVGGGLAGGLLGNMMRGGE